MSQLVTIKRVDSLLPIPGADFIEMAQTGDWKFVVKKGEFKEGDLGVYFRIDSFLPSTDERFKFLEKEFRKDHLGNLGAKLKTRKFKGQISQGLMMPLSLFPELKEPKEGDEVSEILGIVVFEPAIPVCLRGISKGSFPSFISKTDQERIQNLSWVYEKEKGVAYEITEKYDGSSHTTYFNAGEVGVCSRNLNLKETDDNLYWKLARESGLINVLEQLEVNLAFQCELYGEGIQKNSKGIKGHKLAIFDIWNIDNQRYLGPGERRFMLGGLFALGVLNPELIHPARDLGEGMVPFEFSSFDEIQNAISEDPETKEGWVFKRHDGAFSFKVISNQYLLNQNER
jgi:RNA ligase (TIGR02306 family)